MEPITTIPAQHRASVAQRIAARSQRSGSGCLIWQGSVDRKGYGKFKLTMTVGQSRHTGTHRAAWLAMVGDIPRGLVIDHLCRTPACVDVSHMELVTVQVNALRGDHSRKRGRSGRKGGADGAPGCGKHGQSDGYQTVRASGSSVWICRPCRRERNRRHRAKIAAYPRSLQTP